MLTYLRYLGPALVGLIAASCLPDGTPPGGPAKSPTCGDGVCDFQTEDCARCPEDCSCCTMVDSRGRPALSDLDPNNPNATNLSAANGEPDGLVVQLDENSDVNMAFGRDVFDRFAKTDPPELKRFEIRVHGDVLSDGVVDRQNTTCTFDSTANGVFEVQASSNGVDWRIVGLWGKDKDGVLVNEFDLACIGATTIRWIRLKGHRDAKGTLDAITAINDDENDPSCVETDAELP